MHDFFNTTVQNILINALAAGLLAVLAYLAPRARSWLSAGETDTRLNALRAFIADLVDAAEQQFSGDDGQQKLAYVTREAQEFAQALGLNVSQRQIRALIEAFVFRKNRFASPAGPELTEEDDRGGQTQQI